MNNLLKIIPKPKPPEGPPGSSQRELYLWLHPGTAEEAHEDYMRNMPLNAVYEMARLPFPPQKLIDWQRHLDMESRPMADRPFKTMPAKLGKPPKRVARYRQKARDRMVKKTLAAVKELAK